MSLILLESWDMIATANLAAKGWSTQGNGSLSIVAGGRTGQGLQIDNGGNWIFGQAAVPAANQHATFIFGGAVYRSQANRSPQYNQIVTFLGDGGTTTHVSIGTDANGYLQASRGNLSVNGGTLLGTATASPIPFTTWVYVEVLVTLSATAGVVTIRVNNTTVLNLTSQNTKNGGTATVFDTIRLGFPSTNTGNILTIDDVYLANGAGTVNNTFLGDMKVQVLRPNANGANSQLINDAGNSTNNYSHVNSNLAQTTTYVGSPTVGNEDTYPTGGVTTGAAVAGVQLAFLATKTDTGARSLTPVVRQSTTDYAGTAQALTNGSNVYQQQINETDPSTSAAWTAAGVNSAQFGMRVA